MTELIWDGKYDKDGRKVAPVRVALPFQTVETVNEGMQERQRALDLFAEGRDSDWRNRLIWGDKKYVLPSLIAEFAGQVDLIYIDPPFDTGADFSFTTRVHDTHETFTKQPSLIEQKAYRDTWGRGLDGYLHWFYETVVLLRELLAETGSIWVHLDDNIGHYAKTIMDEVFGSDCYINCITWKRSDAHSDVGQGAKHLGRVCDYILYYCRTPGLQTINMEYMPLPQSTVDKWYRHVEEDTGRRYNKADLSGPGGAVKGNPVYEWNGITRAWRFSKSRMAELDREGKLVYSQSGIAYIKRYLDESKGIPLQDLWDDIKMIRGIHANSEGLNYPTQKPEALLERIVKAASNEGDLVLDSFCGSGTTAAVAEKLNRRWVTCDLGRFAVHTTRKRLLSISNVKPFVVQNLGKYERQAWQKAEFEDIEDAQARDAAYRRFILDLYHANPLSGHTWLHGVKAGRMVHVGTVDAPVTMADVREIAAEAWRTCGREGVEKPAVDVLGWELAFEINETAIQMAAEANVALRFMRIPREVLERKAVEQGDIKFFEMGALQVKWKLAKRALTLELEDFIISPQDVPEDVRQSVKHWEQWIDYWAVDWDNKDDTFHNQWQSYRTRQDPSLQTRSAHQYEEPGEYQVVVKVIDILGNDTTKTITVGVK